MKSSTNVAQKDTHAAWYKRNVNIFDEVKIRSNSEERAGENLYVMRGQRAKGKGHERVKQSQREYKKRTA